MRKWTKISTVLVMAASSVYSVGAGAANPAVSNGQSDSASTPSAAADIKVVDGANDPFATTTTVTHAAVSRAVLPNPARVAKMVADLVALRPKASPPGAVPSRLKRLAKWLRREGSNESYV